MEAQKIMYILDFNISNFEISQPINLKRLIFKRIISPLLRTHYEIHLRITINRNNNKS